MKHAFFLKTFAKRGKFILLFCFLFAFHSCYTFTGAALTHGEETIQIRDFINNTAYNPGLAQEFSIAIQNRFLQRTTLKGTTSNPDMLVEGEIVDYNISPTTISSPTTGADNNIIQAAQNKLSISVKVHYENKKDPNASFDKTYTDETTFDSGLDINTIETSQVPIVNDRIINKIFNDIVANW